VKTTKDLMRTLVALEEFKKATHHTKYIESVPDLLGASV
jgi:acetyl-CoA carboxylase biotin carboxylase subunit